MRTDTSIRVLVVDDSAIVRRVLTDALDAEPDIKVVGTAPDPYVARDKILQLEPDVLTLDIEMPRMDGLTFLKKLMRYKPIPVIVISSVGSSSCAMAMEAMRSGAVEVLAKPSGPYSVGELKLGLAMKIRAAARARLHDRSRAAPEAEGRISVQPALAGSFRLAAAGQPCVDRVNSHADIPEEPALAGPFRPAPDGSIIAIGASTGGTVALERLLRELPEEVPGTVIVQHIPAGFSRAFANRLHQVCRMEVREAAHGDYVVPGRVLIAPGDLHMLVRPSGHSYRVTVKQGPRVRYQRPSVDLLFESVARSAGARAVGVILTGMGSDGAAGMLKMRQAGAYNLAQNEESCVVYGMPREAVRVGAVDQVLPLDEIAREVLRQTAGRPVERRPAR